MACGGKWAHYPPYAVESGHVATSAKFIQCDSVIPNRCFTVRNMPNDLVMPNRRFTVRNMLNVKLPVLSPLHLNPWLPDSNWGEGINRVQTPKTILKRGHWISEATCVKQVYLIISYPKSTLSI